LRKELSSQQARILKGHPNKNQSKSLPPLARVLLGGGQSGIAEDCPEWTGFDVAGPPLAVDDIRREREL
jgi:hypothetical protein